MLEAIMQRAIPFDATIVAVPQPLGDALLGSIRPTMRVLIVADGEIAFEPGAGFGISDLIDVLSSPPGWTTFYLRAGVDVDLARRGLGASTRNANPARHEPTYENFRFDMPEFDLADYDQVWLFGFWSEDHPGALTAAEIDLLTTWMNAGGGVFATGDHGTLGAALCKDIPRVRSMRRWVAAQNPPPLHGAERHVTTQPATEAQGAGYQPIPGTNEWDAHPKPISPTTGFLRIEQDPEGRLVQVDSVHPLLCGIGGPITTLPDHPHEGDVVEFVDLTAVPAGEFPDLNGTPFRHDVVARARSGRPITTETHLRWEGGPVREHDFVEIAAYDGERVGVGRIVVDASLANWLDWNIEGLTPEDLAKVVTYYLNVALWLAPPEFRHRAAVAGLMTAMLRYQGAVDVHAPPADLVVVGRGAREVLRGFLPDCEVADLVMNPDWNAEEPKIEDKPIEPIPDECLSCPPWEDLAAYTLGGMVESVRQVIARYARGGADGEGALEDVQRAILAAVDAGAARGREEFAAALRTSFETADALADLAVAMSKSEREKEAPDAEKEANRRDA
jgi:hypothetical protein